ncbi:MAG: YkgJ family cysteine cluster protein [Chlamydiia bacterium]|nr:YkgJ family cysteine cluster protein [Chlamydiia bacterium]
MKLKVVNDEVWYREGLPFGCTGCGQCCEGAPGYVWVSPEEVEEMARYLEMEEGLFRRRYTRQVGNRVSLIELPKQNYRCVFLKEKQCLVYGARPTQCRTFPFWKHHLKTKEDWDKVASYCEGIHNEAPLHTVDEIEQISQLNGKQ